MRTESVWVILHALRRRAAADLEGFAHSAAAVLRLAPGSWQALAGRISALRAW